MTIGLSQQIQLFDEILKPYFKNGFKRRGKRGIYKIENGLVYVISFQFGRNNNVYLQYFVNSISNVFSEIFHTLEFGKRLQGNEYGNSVWCIEQDRQFDTVVSNIKQSIKELVHPFFLKINSIERLYFHYLVQFQYTLLPFSAALLSAQINEKIESINYCERSIADIETDEEFDIRNVQKDKEIYSYLLSLKQAIKAGTVSELILSWEEKNMKKYKIVEVVA
ncbi:MAG: DUF4304 domain-containing protein [Saccharospirillaceae bacterium]|nr:DUF4304 domain-containing protein [Pseudomonadales bacterium]NRB78326.1 DUF4304 domain-containing protein [Saccharospirillaceae bacterium]